MQHVRFVCSLPSSLAKPYRFGSYLKHRSEVLDFPFLIQGQTKMEYQVASLKKITLLSILRYFVEVSSSASSIIRECLSSHYQHAYCNEVILKEIVDRYPEYLVDELLCSLVTSVTCHLNIEKCKNISICGLQEALKRCPQLESLNLSGCNHLAHPLLPKILGELVANLKVLNFSDCKELTDGVVQGIFCECTHLEEVSFACCDAITDNAFHLREPRPYFTLESSMPFRNIKSIDVSGCHLLSSTTVRQILSMSGPYLKKANLSWTNIDCSALVYLAGHGLSSAVFVATNGDGLTKPFSNIELNKAQLFEFQSIYGANEEGNSFALISNSRNNGDGNKSSTMEFEHCLHTEMQVGNSGQEQERNNKMTLLEAQVSRNTASSASNILSSTLFNVNNDSTFSVVENSHSSMACTSTQADKTCDESSCNKQFQVSENCIESSSNNQQCSAKKGASSYVESSHNYSCSCCFCLPPIRNAKVVASSDVSFELPLLNSVQQDQPSGKKSCSICSGVDQCTLLRSSDVHYNMKEEGVSLGPLAADDYTLKSDDVMHCDEDCDEELPIYLQDVTISLDLASATCSKDDSCSPANMQLHDCKTLDYQASFSGRKSLQDERTMLDLEVEPRQSSMPIQVDTCGDNPSWSDSTIPSTITESKQDATQAFKPTRLYTPSIEVLDISEINFYSQEMAESCIKMFSEANRDLKTLHISWKNLDDNLFETVISNQSGIRVLSLIDCEMLSNSAIIALGKHCTELTALDLKGVAFITDNGLQSLIVKGCKLQSLGLAESSISDMSLKRLARYCEKQLTHLDLSWCENITDSGIAHVVINCPNLRALDLRQCNASSKTFNALAKHVKCLSSLGLCGVESLTDRFADPIFRNLIHLTDIDLSWNSSLTDESIFVLLTRCLQVRNVALAGLKRLTAKPFLPIIAGLEKWECLLKRIREDILQERTDLMYSRDCAAYHSAFFLPHRSYHYAPSLRRIDLSYCDKVNDMQLAEISSVSRGSLHIDDYYGEPIRPRWNLF